MPIYGASDIRTLIRDMGSVVVVGAVTTRGLVDSVDQEMLREQFPHLIGRVRTVVMDATESGVLAAITAKGNITVDAVAYKIHAHELLDDGGLVRVTFVLLN
jgi:hypothetical protein